VRNIEDGKQLPLHTKGTLAKLLYFLSLQFN